MDASTLIALAAMLVALFGALIKYIDRWRARRHEAIEKAKKQFNLDVERNNIVVRGAEGALILMERALKTANDECDKRINELEEELTDLRCENSNLKENVKELRVENSAMQRQIEDLNKRLQRIE